MTSSSAGSLLLHVDMEQADAVVVPDAVVDAATVDADAATVDADAATIEGAPEGIASTAAVSQTPGCAPAAAPPLQQQPLHPQQQQQAPSQMITVLPPALTAWSVTLGCRRLTRLARGDVGAYDTWGVLTGATLAQAIMAVAVCGPNSVTTWWTHVPELLGAVEGLAGQRMMLRDPALVARLVHTVAGNPWMGWWDAPYFVVVSLLGRVAWLDMPPATGSLLPHAMAALVVPHVRTWSSVLNAIGYDAVLPAAALHWLEPLLQAYPLMDVMAIERMLRTLRAAQRRLEQDAAKRRHAREVEHAARRLMGPLFAMLSPDTCTEMWRHHLLPMLSRLGWAHLLPAEHQTLDALRESVRANPLEDRGTWGHFLRVYRARQQAPEPASAQAAQRATQQRQTQKQPPKQPLSRRGSSGSGMGGSAVGTMVHDDPGRGGEGKTPEDAGAPSGAHSTIRSDVALLCEFVVGAPSAAPGTDALVGVLVGAGIAKLAWITALAKCIHTRILQAPALGALLRLQVLTPADRLHLLRLALQQAYPSGSRGDGSVNGVNVSVVRRLVESLPKDLAQAECERIAWPLVQHAAWVQDATLLRQGLALIESLER